MKRFSLLLIVLFLVYLRLIAQSDTTVPLSVTIKINKAYDLKFPKNRFRTEIKTGQYVVKTDSVRQKQFDIEVSLRNNAKRPIYIWLMSCSWLDNFEINNDYIFLDGIECDKNIPDLVKFEPGETKVYKTTLSKSIKFDYPCQYCFYGPQVETTKLGLIIIDDMYMPKLTAPEGYHIAMADKSFWKIVWSNPLYLLTKKEAKSQ
jgi:hypothetical protein